MRGTLRLLPLLLLLPACNGQDDKDAQDRPGVTTAIGDRARPDAPPPANATTPAAPPPGPPTPSPTPSPSAATPPGLIPTAYQGRWTGEGDQCGDRAAALELTVTPDRLIFHESVGRAETVRSGGDNRIMVDAAFTGEGQSWRRGLMLARAGDRLIVTNDGTDVARKRC